MSAPATVRDLGARARAAATRLAAASTADKNTAPLRGSAGPLHSNQAIVDVLRDAATKAGLPTDCVLLVDDVRHEAAVELMQLAEFVDCLIPRGGASLIQSIREHATVPVIIDGDGNCHVYVDEHADLEMALAIVVNAKT